MTDSGLVSGPRDAEVMEAILKEMGVTEYDPMVVHQMLEFVYRYVTNVLEDAKVYSEHAKKKEVDVADVRLAIENKMDHSFTPPPPRELLLEIARQKNAAPLPLIPDKFGVRLPPERYCLTSNNYSLKKVKKPTPAGPNVTLSATLTSPLSTIKPVQMGPLGNLPASLLQNVLKAQMVPSAPLKTITKLPAAVATAAAQPKIDTTALSATSPMLSMPDLAGGGSQLAGKKRNLDNDNT